MSGQHAVATAVLALLLMPLPARAQRPADTTRTSALCWTARPAPRCRVLLLTNLGVFVDLVQAGGSSSPRMTEDVGLMVNVSRRDAVGFSILVTSTTEGYLTAGGVLRYRRWTNAGNSWDVGLGARGAVRGSDQGAVTGLVRYNVGPYFALAVRPEIVRSDPGTGAGSGLRLSAGVETGSWPSVAVALLAGLIGGVVLIAHPPSF